MRYTGMQLDLGGRNCVGLVKITGNSTEKSVLARDVWFSGVLLRLLCKRLPSDMIETHEQGLHR